MKRIFPAGFSDIGESHVVDPVAFDPADISDDLLCTAIVYVGTLYWVKKTLEIWKGFSFDGVVGVHLVRLEPNRPTVPQYHWIISGPVWKCEDMIAKDPIVHEGYRGLPCAYIWSGYPEFDDPNAAPTPLRALESYCGVIERWVAGVRRAGDGSRLFPVATPEAITRIQYADYVEPILGRVRAEILRQKLKHA
jgi:hypothetical protein